MKEKSTKSKKTPQVKEIRSEYSFDYAKAVRGKYYRQLLKEGSNIVVLEPDIARAFHDSEAVNKALRSLLELSETTAKLTRKTT